MSGGVASLHGPGNHPASRDRGMRYAAQAMAVAVLLLGLPLPSGAGPPQDVFDDELPPPARPGPGTHPGPAPVAGVSRLRRFQRDRRVVTPSDMRPARPYSGGRTGEPSVPALREPSSPAPELPAPQPVPVAQPAPLPPPLPATWVAMALPWRPGVGQPGAWPRPLDTLARRRPESGVRVAALALSEPPPVPRSSGPVVGELRPAPTGSAPVAATPVAPGTPGARLQTGPAVAGQEPKPTAPEAQPARSPAASDRGSQLLVARAESAPAAGAVDPRPGPVAPRPAADAEPPPPPPALPLRSPRPVAAVVERAPPAPPPAPPLPRPDAVIPAGALDVPLLATSAGQPAPASGARRRGQASGGGRGLLAARVVARSRPVRSGRWRPSSAAASGRSGVTARLSRASAKALSGVPLPALARPAAGNAPEMAAPVQRVVLSAALQPTVLMPAGPRTALLGLIAPNVSVGRITVSLPLGRHEAKPVVSAMAVVPPLLVVSPRGWMDRWATGPWPLAFPEPDTGVVELVLAAEALLLPQSVAPMGIRRGVLAPEAGASGRRRRLPQRFRGAPGASSRGTPERQPPSEPLPVPPEEQAPEPPSSAGPAVNPGAPAVSGPSGPAPQLRRRTGGR